MRGETWRRLFSVFMIVVCRLLKVEFCVRLLYGPEFIRPFVFVNSFFKKIRCDVVIRIALDFRQPYSV